MTKRVPQQVPLLEVRVSGSFAELPIIVQSSCFRLLMPSISSNG
jgi:hypothetical protein